MIEEFRHVRTAACCNERLNMLVNTSVSWSAYAFRTQLGTLFGPATFLALTFYMALTWWCCKTSISSSGAGMMTGAAPLLWVSKLGLAVRQCLDAVPHVVGVIVFKVILSVLFVFVLCIPNWKTPLLSFLLTHSLCKSLSSIFLQVWSLCKQIPFCVIKTVFQHCFLRPHLYYLDS